MNVFVLLQAHIYVLASDNNLLSQTNAEWQQVYSNYIQIGITILIAIILPYILYLLSKKLRYVPYFMFNNNFYGKNYMKSCMICMENLSGKHAYGEISFKSPIYILCSKAQINNIKNGNFYKCFHKTLNENYFNPDEDPDDKSGIQEASDRYEALYNKLMNNRLFIYPNKTRSNCIYFSWTQLSEMFNCGYNYYKNSNYPYNYIKDYYELL